MSVELDKILRDFGEEYWSDIEHGDGDHSITVTEATNTIQVLIAKAYFNGYNDNARDCYCDSKKAIESIIPHKHLMDDGESHDIKPDITALQEKYND